MTTTRSTAKGFALAITAIATIIFGMSLEGHYDRDMPAPAPAVTVTLPAPDPTPEVIDTNIWDIDYTPLIDCAEDEACWIGSGADGRGWVAITTDMLASGWEATDSPGCYMLIVDNTTALMRCADGYEGITPLG